MLKLIIVWALAALITLNSLLVTFRSNFTTGTIVLWCISAMLIVYGIFHKHIDAFCRQGFGFALKCVFIAGMLVFIALFVFVAVSGYTDSAKGDEKAIIVLGAGLRGERVGDVLRRRLQSALESWQSNPESILVVTGGQGPQEDIPEAVAMQRWLLQQGVPASNIIVEDKSTSTEENLAFAAALLLEQGIAPHEPVVIVTNAFHCYRAGLYAEKVGFKDARTIPASMNLATTLPSYTREVLAILHFWVFQR